MARDFTKTADEIVKYIGGKGNVSSLYHCATRLRFRVNDREKVDKESLERVEGVIGVMDGAGQVQVVIGNKVPEVYKTLFEKYAFSNVDSKDIKEPFMTRMIAVLSGIFQPIIPALAGAGLLKGLIAIGMVTDLLHANTVSFMMLNVASDGVFYFLPVFLSITAARKFGANEFLALGIAVALCHPMLEVAYTAVAAVDGAAADNIIQALSLHNFAGMKDVLLNYGYPEQINNLNWFGIPFILMHYGYSVIPIIFAVWALSYVEHFIYRHTPEVMRLLVAPAIVLLIMVPFTLLVVGPIGGAIGDGLGWLLKWLNDFSGLLFGAFLGFFWQVMVIFGVHWSTAPITFNNFAIAGVDYMGPITAVAVLGQVGATFAVALRTRNKTLRGLGISTGITGALGITEPLIYGVTLRLKKPFLFGCIGGAIGGAVAGAGGALAYAYSFGGLLALPAYLGPEGDWGSLIASILGMGIAFSIGFLLTLFIGFDDLPEATASSDAPDAESLEPTANSELVSPLSGEIIALENVNDAAFASGAMGKGIGIDPSVGELCAPCDGVVEAVFPTKHVVAMRDAHGAEIMMHIGVDTVELKGEGFNAVVEPGQAVKTGDVLIRFDIAALKKRNIDLTTSVLIVNSDDYDDVLVFASGHVNAGDKLLNTSIKE